MSVLDLIGLILGWFLWDFLDENYPRFFKWVILPLVLPLALLVVIAPVVSCVADLLPDDAVENVDCGNRDIRCINGPHSVDCSAPAIRCINTDGDLP